MSKELQENVDIWANGHEWVSSISGNQCVVTCDDGVSASVWMDQDGTFHALQQGAESP